MKNASVSLSDAWFAVLETIGNYPVYDGMAPDTATGSYIILGERNIPQGPDKCGFIYDANILVDVVNKNGSFGYAESDRIVTQILALVNSQSQLDLSPDFQCITTVVLNQFNLSDLNNTEPVFRSLVRYYHKITQL